MQAIKMVTLISPLAPGFRTLGTGWASFLVFVALLAVGLAILGRTPWGRHVYAAGGNPAAARLSGVSVTRTIGWTYVASGFTAGMAGLVAAATLDSVQGNMFMGYELDAVAAVVLGGTSMTGGRGGVFGTAIGAALMAVLRNGLIVKGLDVFWYQAIIGIAILGVAALDWAAGRVRERQGGAA
jgi:ribose transport system permease protein